MRKNGPIASFYGPYICGDAIDFKCDGHTIVTGSYRQKECIELWDLRVMEKFKTVHWVGPEKDENFDWVMEDDTAATSVELKKEEVKSESHHTPYINACCYNSKKTVIMAGGAGEN